MRVHFPKLRNMSHTISLTLYLIHMHNNIVKASYCTKVCMYNNDHSTAKTFFYIFHNQKFQQGDILNLDSYVWFYMLQLW